MTEISPQWQALLTYTKDSTVCEDGFQRVGFPDYGKPDSLREPIPNVSTWTEWSGVHLNPKFIKKQADNGFWYDAEWLGINEDRTFTMDFDLFDKVTLEPNPGVVPVTVDDMIEKFKAEGVPLPYCATPSKTPGNFHLTWLFRTPQPRYVPSRNRDLCFFWQGDPGFTNSMAWNPEYRYHHPNRVGDRTRWWDEWSDELPMLDSRAQLRGISFAYITADSKTANPITPDGQRMKFLREDFKRKNASRAKPKTEAERSTMVDGDGRTADMRTTARSIVTQHHKDTGSYISQKALLAILLEVNKQYGEVLAVKGVKNIVKYWTPGTQEVFLKNQQRRGLQNFKAREDGLQAEQKYLAACIVKQVLAEVHGVDGEGMVCPSLPPALTPSYLVGSSLDLQSTITEAATKFEGKKLHRGKLTNDYIAFTLLEVYGYGTEELDTETGEIAVGKVVPMKAKALRDLFTNGAKRDYSIEHFTERSNKLDQDQAEREAQDAERRRVADLHGAPDMTRRHRLTAAVKAIGESNTKSLIKMGVVPRNTPNTHSVVEYELQLTH